MTHLEMKKKAVEVMKQKLGFAPRIKDVILLESAEGAGQLEYLLFGVNNVSRLVYHIVWMPATLDYTLQIEDTHESLYIS